MEGNLNMVANSNVNDTLLIKEEMIGSIVKFL